jgi:hypothetical protein
MPFQAVEGDAHAALEPLQHSRALCGERGATLISFFGDG